MSQEGERLMEALREAAAVNLRNPQVSSVLPMIVEVPAAEVEDWQPTWEQAAVAAAGILVVPQEVLRHDVRFSSWPRLPRSPTLRDVGFHRVEWRDD